MSQPPHPVNGLDELVHQRVRLGILAIAAEAGQVDFGYLHGALQLTDGNLSRHLQVLEQAKLIAVRKGYSAGAPGPGCGSPPRAARRSLPSWQPYGP